jgi:hypothetical protein
MRQPALHNVGQQVLIFGLSGAFRERRRMPPQGRKQHNRDYDQRRAKKLANDIRS